MYNITTIYQTLDFLHLLPYPAASAIALATITAEELEKYVLKKNFISKVSLYWPEGNNHICKDTFDGIP